MRRVAAYGWRLLARWWPRGVLLRRRTSSELLGYAGEAHVARRLRAAGWRILGRRLATPRGEVDVVALDGDVLVVAEVKTGRTLPDRRWTPGDRFQRTARQRMERAARWLAPRATLAGGQRVARWRVDLVEVFVDDTGRSITCRHHRGRVRSE